MAVLFFWGGLLPEFIDIEADADRVGLSRGEGSVVEIVVRTVAQEVVDGKSDRQPVLPTLDDLELVEVIVGIMDLHDALLGVLRGAVFPIGDRR